MREDNFRYMFAALILFLIIVPLFEYWTAIPQAFKAAISFTFLLSIGVWSMRNSIWVFRMGILLAGSGILLNVLSVSAEVTILDYLARLAVILFLLLATWSGLRQVVFSEKMNINRIYGAVCIYLLLGVTWALLYNVIYTADADAFSGMLAASSRESDVQWLYYSFVTLTTLGYGDILPVGPVARTLAYAEAIVGVFYMAILVAMLVSAYAADRQKNG